MKKFTILALLLCLAFMWSAAAQADNLLTNGSFETGPTVSSSGYLTLTSGNTSITGWTVGGSGIDYISTYWHAEDGGKSLDLNAAAAGSIFQSFSTTAGQKYHVSFYMSGNPEIQQGIKTMQVTIGSYSGVFSYDTTGKGLSQYGQNLPLVSWDHDGFDFTATGATSTLTFTSTASGPCGPVLDNVTVSHMPLPPTLLLLGSGLLGLLALRRRRDHKV